MPRHLILNLERLQEATGGLPVIELRDGRGREVATFKPEELVSPEENVHEIHLIVHEPRIGGPVCSIDYHERIRNLVSEACREQNQILVEDRVFFDLIRPTD